MVLSWLVILSFLFLFFCYKSSNPLVSSLSLVFSLCLMSPYMICVVPNAFIYLMTMIFLSGLLVLVTYFSSLSSFNYKKIPFIFLFLLVLFFGFPFCVVNTPSINFSFLYNNIENLIYSLISLFLFLWSTSYFVSSRGAMRSF